MKSLTPILIVAFASGCTAETEGNVEEQDVTSALTASIQQKVVESSATNCIRTVVYHEVVSGIPEAARKRINERLKPELPPCSNQAQAEDTLIEQLVGMNEMGVLSVEQRTSGVRNNVYFLFDMETGKELTSRDVLNAKGEAVLIGQCERDDGRVNVSSSRAALCADIGEALALTNASFISHTQLVGGRLPSATRTSFKLFEPAMFKSKLVKNLIVAINSKPDPY